MEKNTRIVSFLNDTADQQEKLEELKIKIEEDKKEKKANDPTFSFTHEDVINDAKSVLSKWGLLHFKLQAILIGEIVFPDSLLWNNFFLHELNENEYNEFVKFVTTQKVIGARCRNTNSDAADYVRSVFLRLTFVVIGARNLTML